MTDEKQNSEIGQLITPKEEKCGYRSKKKTIGFVYTGAINVCEKPNRERPARLSRDMNFGETGMVLDIVGKRFKMFKVLTKDCFVGYVLASDVLIVS
jgi:hypothetical protein